MAGHRPRRARVAAAVLHAPQFVAGQGVVGVKRFRPRAQQRRPPIERSDLAGGKGLAEVPFGIRRAIRPEILEINGPVLLPDRPASFLVERDNKLPISAIEVQDQQITIGNGRGASASEMIALYILPLPEHFAGLCVEADGAWRAEGCVKP